MKFLASGYWLDFLTLLLETSSSPCGTSCTSLPALQKIRPLGGGLQSGLSLLLLILVKISRTTVYSSLTPLQFKCSKTFLWNTERCQGRNYLSIFYTEVRTKAILMHNYLWRIWNGSPTCPLNSSDTIKLKTKVLSTVIWPATVERRLHFLNIKKLGFEKLKNFFPSLNKLEIGGDGEWTA